MFENLSTALVQAIGFIAVFGFFIFQLLSDVKKPKKGQSKNAKLNLDKSKNLIEKTKRKGLFNRKLEQRNEEVQPKKKGWFK